MSPVAPSSGSHVGRAATVALVGVVVLFAVLGLVTFAFRNTNSPKLRLGDQTFQAGSASDQAAAIVEHGPIFYSDVSGRQDRPIILQHLGDDEEEGWYAFLAHPTDKGPDCPWIWQPKQDQFRAKCDLKRKAPADGEGLPRYPVTVTDGRLDIDLNADARTTSTAPTTTTGG